MAVFPKSIARSMWIIAFGVLTACGSTLGGDDADAWSRSFAYPIDEVWAAAEEALLEEGLELEAEPAEERIFAEDADGRLELKIRQRGELVVVDVAVRGGLNAPVNPRRVEPRVHMVLEGISARLREGAERR